MFRRLLFLLWLTVCLSPAHAQTWYWSSPMPHGNSIIALNYYAAGGLGIEACDSGQIYTSPDFTNWIAQASCTTNSLQAIAFLNNRIILTGQSGTVVYSDDGYNYNYTNLNTNAWLVGVAASTNLAVAVGDDAVIYTSTDGANWTLGSPPPGIGNNWLLAAAYGAGTFIIVGEGGYLATSTNGTTWKQRTISTGFSANINDVQWIRLTNPADGFPTNSFVVSCDNGKAYYSTTRGTNWTAYDLPSASTNSLYSAAASVSNRVAVGASTVYLGTNNSGSSPWQDQTDPNEVTNAPALDWTYFCAVGVSNSYAIAGNAGMLLNGAPDPVSGQYDWTPLDTSPRDWLWNVFAVSDILYVAVGDNARIMSSLDGVGWAVETLSNGLSINLTNTVLFGVGGTTNVLLAVGSGGAMAYSLNNLVADITTNSDGSLSTNYISDLGIDWYNSPAVESNNDLQCVAVYGTNFYVAGGGGSIYYSSNPTNATGWTKAVTPTTNYLSGMDVFSNMLVCVGNAGTILTSLDGVTWTKQTSHTTNWIFRVRNCCGTLVAVGEKGTILTSVDGTNWLASTSGTTNWLHDIDMVTNNFYAVGDYATVLTSTDAVNWSPVPIITDQSLFGLATIQGQLVTVGQGGSILRAQIVPDLNPLNIISFSTANDQCIFFVGTIDGSTDITFTLDSSPDLVNWTTGPQVMITAESGTVLFSIPSTNAPMQYYRATLVPPN